MEDYSDLFMEWGMDTLQQLEHLAAAPVDDDCCEPAFPPLQAFREASQAEEMVRELIGQPHAASSWSSGDGNTTTGGGGAGNVPVPALSRRNSATILPVMSWNFGAASAPPGRDGVSGGGATTCSLPPDGSPPARRAVVKSVGSMYGQEHIIAERKRREKINQRFIELSTVIPGLKKMDKATILSDATSYVKELQEKLKALQDGSNDDRSIESWVLVKKPCVAVADDEDSSGSPSPGTPPATFIRKPLPEIEARFLEKSVMVRIHCEDGRGVAMRAFTEIEELHLSIIHANVMPFRSSTLIITITAKASLSFHFLPKQISTLITIYLKPHFLRTLLVVFLVHKKNKNLYICFVHKF